MRILVVGLDPTVLDPNSPSARRQATYFAGNEADIFEMVPGPERSVAIGPSVRSHAAGGASRLRVAWSTLWAVRKLLRAGRYDVLTVQDPLACGLVGAMARIGSGTRLHVQDHSAYFSRPPKTLGERLLFAWASYIARCADRIRTVSVRGLRGIVSIGIAADKVDVVSVPTDIPRFAHVVHPPAGHPRLLTVARLSHEKGIDVLLQAFRRILDKRPTATLTIVGEGPERAALTRLAQSLDIASAVRFAGQQTDLERFFSDADVYIQPSRFEGWGMAVVEAAAAALPIVMSDVGCAGEALIDGESGVVVPTDDVPALADAIAGLLDDPVRAEMLAYAARRSVLALPTFEQSVLNVRASLQQTAEATPPSSSVPLFLASLAVRLIPFLLILAYVGPKGFELGDSTQYLGLAHSLLSGHGFSYEGVPFFYRTIGYPLFLAGGLAVFRSTAGFILFQIVLASCIPLVLLRLGRELRLGRRATWIAAWIAAFEPHLVYYSVTVMAESLYTLVLLLGLVYVFRAMQSKHFGDSVKAGVAFGIGMLIKPLLQFFPAALLVVVLPWAKRINWRDTLKHVFVVFATVGIITFPWVYRNYRTFGSFSLSSQGPNAALFYLGTSIVSVRDHISYQNAEEKVKRQFVADTGLSLTERGTDQNAARAHAALEYIKTYPSIVLRLIAINTLTFWTSSNYNSFLNYYHLTPPIDHSVLPPTHFLAQGRFADFFGSFWQIFSQPFYIVGVLGRIVWILITLFFLYGMCVAYRRILDRRFQWLFLLALCLYLTATIWVDGLGIEARLRCPLMPIEFLYAAYGWCVFWKKRERKKPLRLLVITQRVDQNDTNIAVHVRWLQALSELTESVTVIAQSVGTYDLPNNVRVLSLGKERGASKVRQLYRFLRYTWRESRSVDSILVLMVPLYVILAAKIAIIRRKPIFLWYTHKRVSFTLRAAVFFVRRVFSASPESFRLKTSKVRFLGHAIDTEFFSLGNSTREAGRLVTVGRVAPVKRIELLVEAVRVLKDRGRDVRLDIIGTPVLEQDRAYEQMLREQVSRLGLDDAVRFLGGMSPEQVRDAYRSASVCLNASATGSLDKALLEAMSCGCPVVTGNEAFASFIPASAFVRTADASAYAEAILRQLDASPAPQALRSVIVEHHELKATMSALVNEMKNA